MSGEEDKGRALSPESAATTGIMAKKLRAQSSEEDDAPVTHTRHHVSFAGPLPGSSDAITEQPAPRRGGASPGSRTSSKSPERPGEARSRSTSPLCRAGRKIVSLLKRTPSPKPPSAGASPEERAATTKLWLQEGRMSREPSLEPEPLRPGSSRSRHTSSSSERSERHVRIYPHPVAYDSFLCRGEVLEKLSDEILEEAGLRPGVAPLATVEEFSSSEGSQGEAMSTAASSSQATTSAVMHSEPEQPVREPPPPAPPHPPPPEPAVQPQEQAAEGQPRRRRRKGEPLQRD